MNGNNLIILGGKTTPIQFSHEFKNEKFYSFSLSTTRTSGTSDVLHCIVPEVLKDKITEQIEIIGEVRTRNLRDNGQNHCELYVFVTDTKPYTVDKNIVELDGFVCKKPIYRETPLGRQITDIMFAVNRRVGCDYVPCVVWGRSALNVAEHTVGTHLLLNGRLQSRVYEKKIDTDMVEIRTTYEVSVANIWEAESGKVTN